jgi:L-asparaginase
MLRTSGLVLAALLLATSAMAQLPHVRVLATGGTIAGSGSANSSSYRSGMVSVTDLIASAPGVEAVATISSEQIANVASSNVDETIWRKLHASAQAALADPGVSGIVITHGTDTLEETAFFLSLLLPQTKPVVVVGSMRPSTAVSADGPQNLLDAIRVAAASDAVGRSVMVVMNDTIFDARSVTKVDMHRVEAFAAPTRGPVGDVLQLVPRFFVPALPTEVTFALQEKKLPKVAIVYAYSGQTGDDVMNTAKGAAGVIIAGVGAGGFSNDARKAVRELTARGIPVVRTPRQGSGDIWPSDAQAGNESDNAAGTIAGRELTPAKARILLMLALQQPRSRAELQALFDRSGTGAR